VHRMGAVLNRHGRHLRARDARKRALRWGRPAAPPRGAS
jgi:hypothetical protein